MGYARSSQSRHTPSSLINPVSSTPPHSSHWLNPCGISSALGQCGWCELTHPQSPHILMPHLFASVLLDLFRAPSFLGVGCNAIISSLKSLPFLPARRSFCGAAWQKFLSVFYSRRYLRMISPLFQCLCLSDNLLAAGFGNVAGQ